MSEKVRIYWEERAKANYNKNTATTNDIHLRELEIKTFIDTINQIGTHNIKRILDLGCGDGRSTLEIAKRFPEFQFLGLDYSEAMIETAKRNLLKLDGLNGRVNFSIGDVTKLGDALNGKQFDIILSDRCLINLDSSDIQYNAFSVINKHLRSGGYFIAIENFVDGHDAMNDARKLMGLPEIPIPWHNKYFKEFEFLHNSKKIFSHVEISNFSSSYYFATRVIYSAMCQMRNETPDYDHEIHQLAIRLPWAGNFSPIKLILMKK